MLGGVFVVVALGAALSGKIGSTGVEYGIVGVNVSVMVGVTVFVGEGSGPTFEQLHNVRNTKINITTAAFFNMITSF